jgi:hypothetical protein
MSNVLYMIIDIRKLKVVQLGEMETICSKQFLEDPEAAIWTLPVGYGSSYSKLSAGQLDDLCKNEGIDSTSLSYKDKIITLRDHLIKRYKESAPLKHINYYEAEIRKKQAENPEFYKQFEPVTTPVETKRFSGASPNKSNTPKASGPANRPAGGTTAKVWEIADAVRLANTGLTAKALRPLIIEECERQGINTATAGTQYAKWKNAQEWD